MPDLLRSADKAVISPTGDRHENPVKQAVDRFAVSRRFEQQETQ